MKLENGDLRPAIIIDEKNGISLKNVENIRIKDCSPVKDDQIKKIISKQL